MVNLFSAQSFHWIHPGCLLRGQHARQQTNQHGDKLGSQSVWQ